MSHLQHLTSTYRYLSSCF